MNINMVDDLRMAIWLAECEHRGQVDKGGMPYIFHPIRVASRLRDPIEQIVAVLHDVVEDGDVRLVEIEEMFGVVVRDAVEALTKQPGEKYPAFIARCKANPIARNVKLADLADNMDLSRIPNPSEADAERQQKYALARIQLEGGNQ